MFAGIDIASERHWLARLDDAGRTIGKPLPITEDRDGYDKLLGALGPAPVLVVLEATGHYWKNLFATLAAAGHDAVLFNPLVARRFQDSSLERIKTDAIDAQGLAPLAFEKRPTPSRLHDGTTEALREFVHHRDRIREVSPFRWTPLMLSHEVFPHAQDTPSLRAGVPATDGRPGSCRSRSPGPVPRVRAIRPGHQELGGRCRSPGWPTRAEACCCRRGPDNDGAGRVGPPSP